MNKLFPAFVFLLSAVSLCFCQGPPPSNSSGAPSLLEILTPVFEPINEAGRAMFPTTTKGMETCILVRYLLLFFVARYEIGAACNSTALSFFGTVDSINPSFCDPEPKILIFSYLYNRLLESEFPIESKLYGDFLRKNGLTLNDRSTNVSTLNGWANVIANRAINYFSSDGWNSQGDLSRKNLRQPFSDYTNYQPVNLPEGYPSSLKYPLRWQPSSGPVKARTFYLADFTGSFSTQVHVLPHIGRAKPLALSDDDLARRKSQSPYTSPNMKGKISRKDKALLDGYIQEYLSVVSSLSVKERFLASFWEFKQLSVGNFLPFYAVPLGYSEFVMDMLGLGDMIAQHDACIVAWREKVRHDHVRPSSIIKEVLKGKKVPAFISNELGVQEVPVEEYEPFLAEQPHSEFPSASVIICTAALEVVQLGFDSLNGRNNSLGPFSFPAPVGSFPFDINEDIQIFFNTTTDAAKNCGMSRLWAGVHFRPSIEAGLEIGKGIGEQAVNQILSLFRGKVPSGCNRCL